MQQTGKGHHIGAETHITVQDPFTGLDGFGKTDHALDAGKIVGCVKAAYVVGNEALGCVDDLVHVELVLHM
jgi:hypothetical protein